MSSENYEANGYNLHLDLRFNNEHNWENLYEHSTCTSVILTLMMNKIFIWAWKIMRQMAIVSIWICDSIVNIIGRIYMSIQRDIHMSSENHHEANSYRLHLDLRFNNEHNWKDLDEHLTRTSAILTLMMNKIFIWAWKTMRQMAIVSIWICEFSIS